LSGDIVHIEKSGLFNVDEVLKSLFMRVGELSDDIFNCLDPEIAPKLDTITPNWMYNMFIYYDFIVD
jgi:hypothetical protein